MHFLYYIFTFTITEDSSSDDEAGKPDKDKTSKTKETEAGEEISALVNYVQPVHFVSFEKAQGKLIEKHLLDFCNCGSNISISFNVLLMYTFLSNNSFRKEKIL